MTKQEIIESLKQSEKALGYAAMYVAELREAFEKDDAETAKSLMDDELEEYMWNARGTALFGVKNDDIGSEIVNYYEELQYAKSA